MRGEGDPGGDTDQVTKVEKNAWGTSWKSACRHRLGPLPSRRAKGAPLAGDDSGVLKEALMPITLIGLAAAFCTTIAFLPQVVQTWRTRSTKDISLWMFLVFTTGIFLWLVYGVVIADVPLIAANGVTFVLSGTILYFKLRYG